MATPGEHIEEIFPGLRGKDWQITSPAATRYNCVAWAAEDTARWWWPGDPQKGYHWPEEAERVETLAAFVAAYATLGYEPCAAVDLEPGSQKVAIFADPSGTPTHVARQLTGGRWTSKLGNLEDIEHDLHDVSGEVYGSVAQLLRRLLPPA
jgi:hypothetical protein